MEIDHSHIEGLINSSLYFEANEHLIDLLQKEPDNLKYQELLALSYSRSGALDSALEFFEPIYRSHKEDPEVSGIMGGIYKRLFQKHQEQPYATMAAEIYKNNYEITGSFYTGINAASMLLMSGKSMTAKEIARDIIARTPDTARDLWSVATLAEAQLILRNKEESKAQYVIARKAIGQDWGKLNAIYKQLWLLNHFVAVPKDVLTLFRPPAVTIFAGHMLDHPDRKEPRFTPGMVGSVKEAILSAINTMDIQIGYSSLACGADILFTEAMLEQHKTMHLILPFKKDDFLEQSVNFAGEEWVARFENILDRIEPEYATTTEYYGKNQSFEFLSKLLMGRGILHARQMDSEANLLTVLSALSLEAKSGGTRYLLNIWPKDLKSYNVNIDKYFVPRSESDQKTGQDQREPKEYPNNVFLSHIILIKPHSEIFSEYKTQISDILAKGLYNYHAFIATEDVISIHLKNELHAMDMIMEIIKVHKDLRFNHPVMTFPKIMIHAGPVVFQGKEELAEASGKEADLAYSLFKQAPDSKVAATENFAACISLSDHDHKFDYSGRLELSNKEFISMYTLNMDGVL